MRVALIGGIGGGKSTALQFFKSRGVKTFSADDENRTLLGDKGYIAKIKELCSEAVVANKIDKEILSARIFSDKSLKARVEAVAHPLIINKILQSTKDCQSFIVEITAPNKKNLDFFDKIIYIRTPETTRCSRTEKREMPFVHEIMKAQPSDAEYAKFATQVIENNGTIEELHEKLEKIILN